MDLSKANQVTTLYTHGRCQIRPHVASLVARSRHLQVAGAEQMPRNPG
jgi:hypothetical protein